MITVTPARLERNDAGVPFSSAFGDIYHSSQGGLAQARHVFLEGNALPARWARRDGFTILETGFGLGLNFLAAWKAWRDDPARPRRLHFVSIEKHPFGGEDLHAALAPFDEMAELARALVARWPPPLAGFHRLHFEEGRVTLTLVLGDARQWLAEIDARADALFLDGFAPARNPEMWSPEVVRELARLSAADATLATWTVAGGVRSALADSGFSVEKRAGFAGKREMLVGHRSGSAEAAPRRERRAVVVGAGLSGLLVADRLAAREWHVELIDANDRRASAAVGLLRPIANVKDALNAQLARAGFLYAAQHFAELERHGGGFAWNACGALQLAEDADELSRFAAIAERFPPGFLACADAAAARELAGRDVNGGGLWFPTGGVVRLQALQAATLSRAGASIHGCFGRSVDRLEREGASWRALDAAGRVLAEADVLVLANAADAARLAPDARLRLATVRGQVTYLPPSDARKLGIVVAGNGYVAPRFEGGHSVGSSFQHDDPDGAVRVDDHVANLARAESLLPGFTAGLDAASLSGWTGFRATVPDRLPIHGDLLAEGLYAATGLGARGLLWAPIGAELIASRLEGEPAPLPRTLEGAISPKRFLS